MFDSSIWVGPKPLELGRPTAWTLRFGALLALLAAAFPGTATAQPNPTAILRGQVVDSSGTPIPLANVRIEGIGHEATSDTLGQFRLDQLPSGRHFVFVRAEGWRPLRFEIKLEEAQEWIGWIGLQPARLTTRSQAPARPRRPVIAPRRVGSTAAIASSGGVA